MQGTYYPPGDKSISHRSLILTGQAIGKSEITNLLEGEDVINTLLVMRELGTEITKSMENIKYLEYLPELFSAKKTIRFWQFRNGD